MEDWETEGLIEELETENSRLRDQNRALEYDRDAFEDNMILATDEVTHLRNVLSWFCERAISAGVRSHLTVAVFKSLLAKTQEEKEDWEARADFEAAARKKHGYPELDWNWRKFINGLG